MGKLIIVLYFLLPSVSVSSSSLARSVTLPQAEIRHHSVQKQTNSKMNNNNNNGNDDNGTAVTFFYVPLLSVIIIVAVDDDDDGDIIIFLFTPFLLGLLALRMYEERNLTV